MIGLVPALWACFLGMRAPIDQDPAPGERASTLTKIHREVRELGSHAGENFIKQEFFIGGPDDDDTNKNISVIILILTIDGAERMTIQVTAMDRDPQDPRIKTARETKTIVASVEGGIARVERSDIEGDALEPLFRQILRAVQDKKRLLRAP